MPNVSRPWQCGNPSFYQGFIRFFNLNLNPIRPVVAWRRRMCYTCKSCRAFQFAKCKRAGCGPWQEHDLEDDWVRGHAILMTRPPQNCHLRLGQAWSRIWWHGTPEMLVFHWFYKGFCYAPGHNKIMVFHWFYKGFRESMSSAGTVIGGNTMLRAIYILKYASYHIIVSYISYNSI